MFEIVTKSTKETKKIAKILATKLGQHRVLTRGGTVVIALEGNLGSGKTTFVQGFARALGVKENVLSPTFVLLKIYPLKRFKSFKRFKHLVHIDCYRLDSPQDLPHLGFGALLKDKDAIILIEWANRIRKFVPRDAIWIKFKHGKHLHERVIIIAKVYSRFAKIRR